VQPAVALIVNAGSGSGRAGPRPDARALHAAIEQAGVGADLYPLAEGDSLDALLDRALESRPRALVAAGGDGTVNAVAERALRHDLPLGILPLGTLNHFARDLGIPEDLAAATRVIAAEDLPLHVRELKDWPTLANYLAGQEKDYLARALQATGGDKARAAKALGVDVARFD